MTCEAVITVAAANVRQQANTSSAVVGIARRGQVLPVLDRTETVDSAGFFWFQVTLTTNNLNGWLRADLIQLRGDCNAFGTVTITAPADDTDNETPVSETPDITEDPIVLIGDCMGTVTVSNATALSSPGLSGNIIGFVSRNTRFVIVDISVADADNLRWYALELNGQEAWIREDVINATGDCFDGHAHDEESTQETPPIVTPEPEQPVVDPVAQIEPCTALAGLPRATVRALPTTNSDSRGIATKGQLFEVRTITPKQSDGFTWVEITFNGQTGYMRSDLVTLLGDCTAFSNDTRLPRPVSGLITQGFRPSTNPTHDGLDFGTQGAQELIAPIQATVARATACVNCEGTPPNIFTTDPNTIRNIFSDPDWGFGYGNHVILQYAFANLSAAVQSQMRQMGLDENSSAFVLYAHLTEFRVQSGQQIDAGTVFGSTGNTGYSTAEHLHMEVAFGTSWGTATKVHPATLFAVQRR